MAKKNPIKKVYNRSPHHKKSYTSHRLPIILLCILVGLLCIGLLYQHKPSLFEKPFRKAKTIVETIDSATVKTSQKLKDTSSKSSKKASNKDPKQKTSSGKNTTSSTPPQTVSNGKFDIHQIKGLDIPKNVQERPSQIIAHKGYTVSYNNHLKLSNWVGYELTIQETLGKEKRTNKFVVDPKVVGATATDADYRGSGYDRGHMAPAGDMTWSSDAMRESFYFSNMAPQEPSLNRGIWKSLETKVRSWAERDSAIYIVCGPVIKGNEKKIGPNQVVVPNQFYKVILSPYGKKMKAIGFLFKNEGSLQPLQKFAVSVDSIEKLTGIDFFYQLPDEVEGRIESGINLNDWF